MNMSRMEFREFDHPPELDNLPDMLENIQHHGDTKYYDMSAFEWSYLDGKVIKEIVTKIFQDGISFSEENEREIEITLEELILNYSWESCKQDEKLRMNLKVYFGEKGLVIHLTDPGPGFDYKAAIEQGRQNINGLTREIVLYSDNHHTGGFGMFSLLNFADHFQFNEAGNEVIVQFNYRDSD